MRNCIDLVEGLNIGIAAPKLLFHGSDRLLAHPFRPFTHFGTYRAALERVTSKVWKANHHWDEVRNEYVTNTGAQLYVYPVVVAICSTLRITDLKGVIKVHTPIMLADLLHYDMPKQILTSAERDEVIGAGDGGYETIAKLLNNKGYDGLVYKNNHEDRGSDSWITLADGQAVPNKPLRLTLADAAQELGITMPKCNSDEIINFAGQSMN